MSRAGLTRRPGTRTAVLALAGVMSLAANGCRWVCGSECSSEGRCTFQGGKCVVASDRDCSEAAVCRDYGRCSAVSETVFVPSDDRLRTDTQTRKSCQAASDADCARSDTCTKLGRCKAHEGGCVQPRPGTRR